MSPSEGLDWLAPEDAPGAVSAAASPAWTILIVDDEREVHAVTQMALRRFRFDERGLHFLHAYSGEEARAILREERSIAVVLLDVVMETERAGLDVVHFVRNDLGDRFVRIVLRTGHPGEAPEHDIISRYDIDNYKEKTELTATRLYTAVYTALRSYRDLMALDRTRRGLEKVISASTHLQQKRGITEFAEGVLEQVAALLHTADDGFLLRADGFASTDVGDHQLVAAAGRYRCLSDAHELEMRFPEAARRAREFLSQPGTHLGDDWFVHCIETPSGRHLVVYLEPARPVAEVDHHLMEMFSHNVAVGMDNLLLSEQVNRTQREIVLMLGEAIEMRSLEAGNHVHRVAEYSALLGRLYGLDEEQIGNLLAAAPLHDVGKIAIEDRILNKPGRHTERESARMREHAAIGAELFRNRELPVLLAAGTVAGEHHENWDGSGYPKGKRGEEIHIFGRIVALADVFDALLSDRCYKQPWPLEKTLACVREQRGRKFDPRLVDLLLDNLEAFQAIAWRLTDEPTDG